MLSCQLFIQEVMLKVKYFDNFWNQAIKRNLDIRIKIMEKCYELATEEPECINSAMVLQIIVVKVTNESWDGEETVQ